MNTALKLFVSLSLPILLLMGLFGYLDQRRSRRLLRSELAREGQAITKGKVTIKLHSTAKPDEEMSWTLNSAFPVKWVGPALNTTEAAVAIETVEFAHHGLMEEIIK